MYAKAKTSKTAKTVKDIKQKPEEHNITSETTSTKSIINNLSKTRLYGVEWTNNNIKCKFKTEVKDRAMTNVITNRPSEPNIIIERNNNGRFWSAVEPETTLKLLKKDYQFYEVLTSDRPRKVYFDIDYIGKADDAFLPLILNGINEVLPYESKDIAISGSINEVKTSYHIILNNYVIKTDTDRNILKGVVSYLNLHVQSAFDTRVYDNHRRMKCINQSKGDGRIQQMITLTDQPEKHIISYFMNENAQPLPDFNLDIDEYISNTSNKIKMKQKVNVAIAVEKTKEYLFDIGQLPQNITANICELPLEFDIHKAGAKALLELLPLDDTFEHSYTHYICRFCFHYKLTFQDFWTWRTKKSLNANTLEKWEFHWLNMSKFPIVPLKNIIFILNKYYPNIRQQSKLRLLIDNFELNPDTKIKVQTLKHEVFQEINKKFIIVNIGMGGGKTHQTIDYLKKLPKDKSFIWMTPNIALAQNTYGRMCPEMYIDDEDDNENNDIDDDFLDDDIDIEPILPVSNKQVISLNKGSGPIIMKKQPVPLCAYYLDKTIVKCANDKHKLNNYQNVMLCMNSLPYITKTYDVVVIDEIETFLNKWHNNKTLDNDPALKNECWKMFIDKIKKAKVVLLLDAFPTKLTTNLINSFNEPNQPKDTMYKIIERVEEPITRTMKLLHSESDAFYQMIEDIKLNRKIMFFCPYKNAGRYNKSMQEYQTMIEKATGKKGIIYNADVSDKVLKGLTNVNKTWADPDIGFVITNTKITVGINYDIVDENKGLFYGVYVGVAGFNMCRDVIQVSYRCRHLQSNIIKAFFFDQNNTHHTFKNDEASMEYCPIYTSMIKDILIEKQAPLKGSFQLFTHKAHYLIETDNDIISEDIRKQIDKLYDDTVDICYTYNTIPTYNYQQIQKLQQRLYGQTATLENKMAINKYHFKIKFTKNANEDMIAKAFDERCMSFFDYMSYIQFEEEDNILVKISNHNNWSNVLPDNDELNKVKLSTDIVKDIYQDFHFTQLTKTAKHGLLYKNVVNCSFNKHVITSEKKGTNYSLKISPSHIDNFLFGQSNLKCYNNNIEVDIMENNKISSDERIRCEKNKVAMENNLAILDDEC